MHWRRSTAASTSHMECGFDEDDWYPEDYDEEEERLHDEY